MSLPITTTMREASRLSVNVAELLGRPGATKRLRFDEEVGGLEVHLAQVPAGVRVGFDLRLDAVVEGIHVSGTLSGELAIECRRCLGQVRRPFAVEVSEVFSYREEPGAEEGYAVRGDRLDLEGMVRDAIVLSLPLNPVCGEDCRGLCAECGQDRNRVDCGHDARHGDLRWEPLRRLGERLERGEG